MKKRALRKTETSEVLQDSDATPEKSKGLTGGDEKGAKRVKSSSCKKTDRAVGNNQPSLFDDPEMGTTYGKEPTSAKSSIKGSKRVSRKSSSDKCTEDKRTGEKKASIRAKKSNSAVFAEDKTTIESDLETESVTQRKRSIRRTKVEKNSELERDSQTVKSRKKSP